jgi:hypothetical protein
MTTMTTMQKLDRDAETGSEMLDRLAAEAVVKEAEAQLKIVRVLAKLPSAKRLLVWEAVQHLLRADELVPGVLEAVGKHRPAKESVDESVVQS